MIDNNVHKLVSETVKITCPNCLQQKYEEIHEKYGEIKQREYNKTLEQYKNAKEHLPVLEDQELRVIPGHYEGKGSMMLRFSAHCPECETQIVSHLSGHPPALREEQEEEK